jgi:hypothetical protein
MQPAQPDTPDTATHIASDGSIDVNTGTTPPNPTSGEGE